MYFVGRQDVARLLNGRSVAIVGSGPGVLGNAPGRIDSHDVVVRVNNFKCVDERTGRRTDVFYSFFGRSIKKTHADLRGVKLCMCKCPNAQFIESEWHRAHNKMVGVDFRRIYAHRAGWWFCPTYVPPVEDFLCTFNMLGRHVPTTGFSAIVDVLSYAPRKIFLTGFDFFRSGVHNLNERWRPGDESDPIGHVPEREAEWLRERMRTYPFECDDTLSSILGNRAHAV